jgi:arylsulfatase A
LLRLSVRSGIGIPNSKYAPHAPGYIGNNLVFTAESIGGLPLNETTTAEALRTAGYATLALGKWHLGQRDEYLPTSRGFDEYLGVPFSQDMGTSFWWGEVPRAPYEPTPLPLLNGTTIVEQPAGLHTLTARYADAAAAFIARQAAAARPFYLYFPFNHVHAPNSCSAPMCGASARGPVGDAVEEMDVAVGRVMAAIKAAGVDDSTLVLFTSDNGAPLGGDRSGNLPLRGGKSQCWEGGYREPAMARWPGKIAAGSTTQEIGSTMDIHLTLLSLAGVQPAADDRVFDGIDLTPVLLGEPQAKGHRCYFFYNYAVASDADNELWAVRCGDFKAYWSTNNAVGPHPGGKQPVPLLFNLVADVGERTPISNSSAEYATAMAEISAARAAHLASVQLVPNQNARGTDPSLALCSKPGTTPLNCTLNPENWRPAPICSSAACLQANPTFAKKCQTPSPTPPPTPLPACPGPACPPVPSTNYKGCFNDHGSHGKCDLPFVITGHCKNASVANGTHGPMSVERCNSMCVPLGFSFFGVQMGGSGCFCGSSYGSQGKAANDSLCNVACIGDPKEMCGGPNLNSVYTVVQGAAW